ncbi:hypothetical protein B0H13DRAFT_2325744 [Mycena leptocephala]|nr:hypothetical protein B0H13DRAFT_2325744 [Mycena leptocephala]
MFEPVLKRFKASKLAIAACQDTIEAVDDIHNICSIAARQGQFSLLFLPVFYRILGTSNPQDSPDLGTTICVAAKHAFAALYGLNIPLEAASFPPEILSDLRPLMWNWIKFQYDNIVNLDFERDSFVPSAGLRITPLVGRIPWSMSPLAYATFSHAFGGSS